MDDLGDPPEHRADVENYLPGVNAFEEERVLALLESRILGIDTPVKIGRFVVIGRVGAGGMGVVYSAFDPDLDRKVAIKLLIDGRADRAEHARLLVEAKAMAKLAHPNVVNVFEVGEQDGRTYVALEYVEGRTLTKWTTERPRRWPESLAMSMQAGRGLAAAHAAGIVHRDFKPDNVLVGVDERARVVDFGLAYTGAAVAETLPEEQSDEVPLTRLTRAGTRIGTPAYMSPEQIRGEEADAQSDQFSFCVVTWEMLGGERPFAGVSVREVFDAVARGRVRRSARGRIPAQLEAVLRRGLATERARRFPSMDALLAALGRAVQRRRWIRVGAAAGGVGFAGVLAWGADARMREVERGRTIAGCETAAAALDASWNHETRARLHDAFLATGLPHAATTAEKLMPWLDAQATAWTDARLHSCLDVEVRRVWNADTFDRASWCLDERRLQFESLVDELAHADADGLNKSVTAAAALSPVASCRDFALLARLPLPPAEARSAVAAVRSELARAAALQAASKPDRALTSARSALANAEALEWPPLVAAAHLRIGICLDKLGKASDAEEALKAAYFAAGQSGAVDVMADAGIYLVFVVGDRLRRFDEAQLWADHVRLALAVLGDEEGVRTASFLNVVGLNASRQGKQDDAWRMHEQALAIRQRVLGPAHPEVAGSLNNLALTQQAKGDFGSAQATIERAIALKESTLGPEHPDVGLSLGNLADIFHDKGDFGRARELHERVLSMREAALGTEHPDIALSLNNLANDHQRVGENDVAQAYLERAIRIWERSRGAEHPDVAMALGNLARLHVGAGHYEAAKPLLERALSILDRALGPDDRGVAILLSNLADAELELGHVARAGELHRRTLTIWEKTLGPDHPDLAYAWFGLAKVALRENRAADAALAAEAALRLRSQGGRPADLADARFMLAEVLYLRGNEHARARALAEQARDTYAEVGHRPDDLRRVEGLLARLEARQTR